MTTPSNLSSRWFGQPPYVPPAESVLQYGAAGDGLQDDTPYIQAAIQAQLSNGVPTNGARTVKSPLIFPPGTYKVTSDILVQSTQYLQLFGYGATIVASGTNFTKAVLNIDGSYRSLVEGFTFIGDGTEQVPSAVKLDFSTAGFRSTTGCAFKNLDIRSMKFVTGLDLSGTSTNQLDGTFMENINIAGQQNHSNWSNSGNWQNGLLCGNGSNGNNYNHTAYNVNCSGCYQNYNINISGLTLCGAEPANGFIDFLIVPGAQVSVSGVQTQNCNEFFKSQVFSPLPVSFTDCLVKSNFINASGYVGEHIGGPLCLRNFSFAQTQVSGSGVYGNTLIHLSNDGSVNRYATSYLENVCGAQIKTSAILPVAATGNANIVCANYMNYSPTTGNYTQAAGDILSYYTGTAWTTIA